jgi:hypothetical protein
MIIVLVLLCLLWIAGGVIGLLFKGLAWMAIVAIVLLAATVALGAVNRYRGR